MTPDELEILLKKGDTTISLDTNAIFSIPKLRKLADLVNRSNAVLDKTDPPAIRLVVSAPAHGEKLLHIRHNLIKNGKEYKTDIVKEGLKNSGITIESFTDVDAEFMSEIIAHDFKDQTAWRKAKRDLFLRQLGLNGTEIEGKDKRCSATTDWLISAQAQGRKWLLVTDDKGPEFACTINKTTLKSLQEALEKIVDE